MRLNLLKYGLILAVLGLNACVTDELLQRKSYAEKTRVEKKEKEVTPSSKVNQVNNQYKKINTALKSADQAFEKGDLEDAKVKYQQILELDLKNDRALAGADKIATAVKHSNTLDDARKLLENGDIDGARAKVRSVIVENPMEQNARNLMRDIEEKSFKVEVTPKKLIPPRSTSLTLEFKEANLRNVFEVISRSSGINFVIDPTVNPELKASIFVKDASVEEAINFLLMINQLEKKVLTANSLLIYPQNRASLYEDLILRTYYLNHAEAKQTASLIRSMLPIKELYVDDKLNMISLKAPYEQLKNIERLIAESDVVEPEVVLDVEVLEVNRSKHTDIGITYPDTVSVLSGSAVSGSTTASQAFTWHDLTHINASTIGVSPAPFLRLLRADTDTTTLANPRIRIQNREKARIHIGDRIPILTSTISSTGNVVGNSANYLDIGLKLDVEPRIMLGNDVSIKLNLEVSSASQAADAKFPTVSTRNTSTVMMATDNETQVLAGLINDEDRKSSKGIPGLGNLPLLGRLFSDRSNTKSKTEIVLLITPHIVRNIVRPDSNTAEFYSGPSSKGGIINLNPNTSFDQLRVPQNTVTPNNNLISTPPPSSATEQKQPQAFQYPIRP